MIAAVHVSASAIERSDPCLCQGITCNVEPLHGQENGPGEALGSTISISEAARVVGKKGGRPKGKRSSALAIWLAREAIHYRRADYRCREAFEILRNAEIPDPKDREGFHLTDYTADSNGIDGNDYVTFRNWRRVWSEIVTV